MSQLLPDPCPDSGPQEEREGLENLYQELPKARQAIIDLEQQVAAAQAELEEYQRLLDDLPGIYEDKFRQKVRLVAQEICHLLDERKALQEQVSRVLVQAGERQSLPAAEADEVAAHASTSGAAQPLRAPKRWADVRLPRFQAPSAGEPRFQLSRLRRPVGLIALAGGVLLALVVFGLQALVTRRITPASKLALPKPEVPAVPSNPAASSGRLTLQASGGESWVLVEDFNGGKMYDAILEAGQSHVLPIGGGIRLRSGRPDLLMVGVEDQPAKPLGRVSDLDWVEIRP